MNPYQRFTELDIWKKVRELKNEIFILVKTFPEIEKFRLSDQLIRSFRGITGCMLKDMGRYTYKDQSHFCMMARGSLSETYSHLIDVFDCPYITVAQLNYYKRKIDGIHPLLNGYITYLKDK